MWLMANTQEKKPKQICVANDEGELSQNKTNTTLRYNRTHQI